MYNNSYFLQPLFLETRFVLMYGEMKYVVSDLELIHMPRIHISFI